jgi:hypothetical protein
MTNGGEGASARVSAGATALVAAFVVVFIERIPDQALSRVRQALYCRFLVAISAVFRQTFQYSRSKESYDDKCPGP